MASGYPMIKEIRWRSPEFRYYKKGLAWYWLTVIAALVLLIAAVWFSNFLFAFFVIIAELLIIFWGQKKPSEIEFKLDDRGLAVGDKKFYPYEALSGFAVVDEEVIFQQKHRLSTYIKALAEPADLGRINSFLTNRLPEFEYRGSLLEHIAKIIRF